MKKFKYLLVEIIETDIAGSEIIKPIFVSDDFGILQLYADEKYLPKDEIRFRRNNRHFNIRKDDENELSCSFGTIIVQYENESRFYRGEVYPRAHIIKLNDEHSEQIDNITVL